MVEYLAVCCATCSVFQVQQRTTSGKWGCRRCGAKQSIVRVFGCGDNAAGVRAVIMRLSQQRGAAEAARIDERLAAAVAGSDSAAGDADAPDYPAPPPGPNVWAEFMGGAPLPAAPPPTEVDGRFVTSLPAQRIGAKRARESASALVAEEGAAASSPAVGRHQREAAAAGRRGGLSRPMAAAPASRGGLSGGDDGGRIARTSSAGEARTHAASGAGDARGEASASGAAALPPPPPTVWDSFL